MRILLILVPIVVYVAQQKTNIKPSIISQITTPSNNKHDFDNTCESQKQKYQELLESESVIEGIKVGTLKGIIKNVSYNSNSKLALLVLTPEGRSNTYELSLQDGNIRIGNTITHKYEYSLVALRNNQNVELSYNCDPKNGDIFTIVSVSINK